jgi:cob(I)alamin adenosyltransferase
MRITKVTTKTGDDGKTSLADGQRVQKNHVIINALGELDHLNSIVGWAEIASSSEKISEELKSIQQDIFNISGDISLPGKESKLLKEERIFFLENEIKVMSKKLPPLKEFILPGGSEFNARLHILRTTSRNTERCLVAMQQDEGRNELHAQYLNRLSDYLFLLARVVGLSKNLEEEHWELNK